jgi:putative hemolysin
MSGVGLDILLIVLLIVANGVFAMSEIAVVSSRKSRLVQRAEEGDAGARAALALAEEPTRFLSTVQIGITLIGILAGAFGGATVAGKLAPVVARVPLLAPYAQGVALALVVLGITYLSLVVGELVPKRVGLTRPESIAAVIARPMGVLSRFAAPAVAVLTVSTEFLLRVMGVSPSEEPPVTEREITNLIDQGTQAGVFHAEEQDLVERVFWLGDQRAGALMTPRHRVVWLDVEDGDEANFRKMREHPHARFLVCRGEIDRLLGMVEVKELWARHLAGESVELTAVLKQPLVVPETIPVLRLLEQFRASGVRLAVVIDEYGGTEGIVALNDILEEIAGDVTPAPPSAVRREDGSWLVDASILVDDFRELVGLPERRDEARGEYRTLGGFVLSRFGRIPMPGDHLDADGLRVEVMDMDGNRIDKVLVSRIDPAGRGR